MEKIDKNKEIDFLIKEFMSINGSYDGNDEIPDEYEDKRRFLRALMNVQIPVQLSDKYYEIKIESSLKRLKAKIWFHQRILNQLIKLMK